MKKGTLTHTKDVTGETIRLGDTCFYDFEGDSKPEFEIVFEENAFRKKYEGWNEKGLSGTLLQSTALEAGEMRIKIKK